MQRVVLFSLLLTLAAQAQETFDLKGNIQTQARRKLWDDNRGNNLDAFFIRANFGGLYKADDFSGQVNVRLFGPIFGDQVITQVTQDTAGIVQSRTSTLHRIWMESLWGQYNWLDGNLTLRVGRWSTTISQSVQLGGYLDQNPWSDFQNRVFWHDAVEATYSAGISHTALMLGIGDRNWNTGYVRLVETLKLPLNTEIRAGYRANLIDRIQNSDAEIFHRMFGRAAIEPIAGVIPFVEVAMIDTEVEVQQVPVLVGVQLPTAGVLDRLVLEAEIVKDRRVLGQKRPVDWNIGMARKFGRTNIVLGIYSDPTADAANNIELATRITSTFK